ncbi:MAG: FAD-dependent oxidoreductase, partial [Oleiphilaceae bacterium]|nr:FAD-dependent oxidoreductase [Oleiphilaceae bacterium]
MKERLVVVGNGMAGMKVVEELVERYPNEFDIAVFGAEPHGNYNRIMLSPVLGGEKQFEDILIHDAAWYEQHGITLHAGEDKEVIEIDRIRRLVVAADGTTEHYDRLLLATGSRPSVLNVPGNDLDGVMAFRSIADVEAMLSSAELHSEALVLGGGLLGLEAANGLAARGMKVTVIHHRQHILNRQLDAQASELLQAELMSRGVEFKLMAEVERLEADASGRVSN